MTAKEKAIELVEKYIDIQSELEETTQFYWGYAQKCALMAVDEILNLMIKTYDWDENTNGNIHFWQEVKEEIEKL